MQEYRIRQYSELNELVRRAEANVSFATRVEDVYVSMERRHQALPSFLNRLFICAWNITDLTLHLPQCTTSLIFSNVILPNLYCFDTNLQHVHLRRFLEAHLSISQLHLRDPGCASEVICPLKRVDLDGVSVLSCPMSCLPSVLGLDVHHLEVTLGGASLLSSDIFQLIPVRPRIECIAADIQSYDTLFLRGLSAFAPNIRRLKLTERTLISNTAIAAPTSSFEDNRVPVWLRFDSWYTGLKALTYLEAFALKTYRELVQPGNMHQESYLIGRWHSNEYTALEGGHPTLRRVGLWYGGEIEREHRSSGSLSLWVKGRSGVFERKCVRLGCPHTKLF